MLVVFLVATSVLAVRCDNILLDRGILVPSKGYSNEDSVISCVIHILKKNYIRQGHLTFVDMDYEDDRLLQHLHALGRMCVVYRKPKAKFYPYNKGYLVTANNASNFAKNFPYLAQDQSWTPYAKFIILVRSMKYEDMRQIFDTLLMYYVLNVVVISGRDPFLYTYNPFEDYACGKYYNRIIKLGQCSTSAELYPVKMINGLRRCTLKITIPHWPPYSIHPSKIKHNMLSKGVEQYLIEMIAKKEQFNITYIYKDNGESYSKISSEMIATGPFQMLQQNETDLMLGGLVLSPLRAAALGYVSSHLDMSDDVKCLVKKALYLPIWKYFYIQFKPIVWVLLLMSLLVFGYLMTLLLGIRDKGHMFLILLDMLLLHSPRMKSIRAAKYILIFWAYFGYLMSCFYQSDMSSLTTQPNHERQVSNIEDIQFLKLKPCLSSAMDKLLIDRNITIPIQNGSDCNLFTNSIKAVSKNHGKYTIVLHSVYYYQKYQFYDEFGNDMLYTFKDTLFKVSYAIYMKKGFPFQRRLNSLLIRLRENGLVLKNFNNQYDLLQLINRYKDEKFHARFIAPWHLFIFGLVVSIFVFFMEVSNKYKPSRNRLQYTE